MTAKELKWKYGAKLIGRNIHTPPMGEYPGGIAEVIALTPDESSPEIVLQVKHPTFGEIGVFDYERVSMV
jgi:hypothetical protein